MTSKQLIDKFCTNISLCIHTMGLFVAINFKFTSKAAHRHIKTTELYSHDRDLIPRC